MTEHVVHSESDSKDPGEDLRRLTFRAWRRGFREADLILGPFAEREGPHLSPAELSAFARLLDADDRALYAWITGAEAAPADQDAPLVARIHAFMKAEVAAVVAEGAG